MTASFHSDKICVDKAVSLIRFRSDLSSGSGREWDKAESPAESSNDHVL